MGIAIDKTLGLPLNHDHSTEFDSRYLKINSSIDHGTLTGLGDDDHTQYATVSPGTTSRNTIQSTSTSATPLVVKGAIGQAVPIADVQISSGSSVFQITQDGEMISRNNTFNLFKGFSLDFGTLMQLATNNRAGVANGGAADFQFLDGSTLGFRFLAAFGNSAGTRYGGFIAYQDRDGNAVPLRFFTNAHATPYENLKMDTDGSVVINPDGTNPGGLDINDDSFRLRSSKTPASAAASGVQGEIAWDSNYVYVCVATNTWKRAALSTW